MLKQAGERLSILFGHLFQAGAPDIFLGVFRLVDTRHFALRSLGKR